MQQKIELETEALELVMKLEASPIGDGAVGMVQIQLELSNLTLQIQDIKKGKEAQDDFWCTKCRTDGHTKDSYPTFMNYVALGAPKPLNDQGLPWCRICQSRGHRDEECVNLQKVVSTLQIYFVNDVNQ